MHDDLGFGQISDFSTIRKDTAMDLASKWCLFVDCGYLWAWLTTPMVAICLK